MGILKKCLAVEKVPSKQNAIQDSMPINVQNSSISVLGHSGHSVPSTEGVFCH